GVELLGEHVVGVALERGVPPGAIGTVFAAVAQAAEFFHMAVGDPGVTKAGGESIGPELRVPAGFGNRPDVDEAPHAVRAEDVDELLDRVGRVPDGENSRRGSHTSRYNYPVEHGRLNGRGQCLHLTRNRVRFRRFSVVLLAEDRAEVLID